MVVCTRLKEIARAWQIPTSRNLSPRLRSISASISKRHCNRPLRYFHSGRASLKEDQRGSVGAAHRPHVPVLLDEVLRHLTDVKLRTFVDGTLGAGGHAAAILEAHPEIEQFLGLDVDPLAHEVAQEEMRQRQQQHGWKCLMDFRQANYSQIGKALLEANMGSTIDGLLLDLGVSSMQAMQIGVNTAGQAQRIIMQMDSGERGFSFMKDGPLDMRMGVSSGASAEQILNTWPEQELARIFRDFGEERHWRAYAAKVVDAREQGPIRTTQQLCAALGHIGRPRGKRSRIHPATRIFQAVRIAVNDELRHLEMAIPECIDCLSPQGRLAVITFHSLEDRIVKRAFLKAAGKGEDQPSPLPQSAAPVLGKIITRKPIVPSQEEEARNPRSRSAKLRVFERI